MMKMQVWALVWLALGIWAYVMGSEAIGAAGLVCSTVWVVGIDLAKKIEKEKR